jgi:3-oxoacyl-[acyl-carrier protein] reductase
MAKWGRLDGLVNNAGTTKFISHADLEGLSGEDFLHIYGINVVGVFQMTRAAAPHLKAADDAAVVNVSSVAGVYGVGSSIAYAASKGALNTMTISLARVLGPEVRVNAVCPGLVETGFWSGQIDEAQRKAIADNYVAKSPLSRFSRPEETARSILFLLTGDPNITGQVLVSDGGFNLM